MIFHTVELDRFVRTSDSIGFEQRASLDEPPFCGTQFLFVPNGQAKI